MMVVNNIYLLEHADANELFMIQTLEEKFDKSIKNVGQTGKC